MLNIQSILTSTLLLALLACGKSKEDHRTERANEVPAAAPADAPTSNEPVIPGNSPVGSSNSPASTGGTPANPTAPDSSREFDDTSWRSQALHYYQWDAALTDLFSPTTAVSQLCWPAAMASEMEYLRIRQTSPVAKLPEIGQGPTKQPDEVRHYANLCGTSKESGTTVIQGVRCLDQHLRGHDVAAEIIVAGVDAQWGSFGLFPEGTKTESGAVSLAKLRAAVSADKSVFLLIGFYDKHPSSGEYRRDRGHFVTLSGYNYNQSWSDERLALKIMNPAVAPSGTNSFEAFPVVELQLVPDGHAMPKDVAFEVIGDGFSDGSQHALVESAIELSVLP